jgi:hypothetical protein
MQRMSGLWQSYEKTSTVSSAVVFIARVLYFTGNRQVYFDLECSTIGPQPVFAARFNFGRGNRWSEHIQWGFCGTVSLELH